MEIPQHLHRILSIVAALIMVGLFITPFVFYPLKVYLWEKRRVRSILRSQIRELRDLAERIGNPYHMARLGAALVEAGEYDEAIQWLEKALDQDSSLKDARFHLARAYLERGEPTRARELLAPVVEAEPTYGYGDAAMVHARAVEESGAPQDAIAAYERLLRYYPNHPEASFRYAMLLAKQGETERARTVLKEMLAAAERAPAFQRRRQRAWLRRARQWLALHPGPSESRQK